MAKYLEIKNNNNYLCKNKAKIGCVSEIKINKFFLYFTQLALPLHQIYKKETKMKKILLFVAAICCMLILGSCKSKSSAYKTAYEQAKSNETVLEDLDEEEEVAVITKDVSYESTRQESVKPVSGEDASGLKKYSVVIGSFQNRTNAFGLKDRMVKEGYRPVVAETETGWLRVIVSSFDTRAEAAKSRDAIKAKHAPNFNDAWLLERK